MTLNEIDRVAWDRFGVHPDLQTMLIAQAAVTVERQRIIEYIRREAYHVEADLWAVVKHLEGKL